MAISSVLFMVCVSFRRNVFASLVRNGTTLKKNKADDAFTVFTHVEPMMLVYKAL